MRAVSKQRRTARQVRISNIRAAQPDRKSTSGIAKIAACRPRRFPLRALSFADRLGRGEDGPGAVVGVGGGAGRGQPSAGGNPLFTRLGAFHPQPSPAGRLGFTNDRRARARLGSFVSGRVEICSEGPKPLRADDAALPEDRRPFGGLRADPRALYSNASPGRVTQREGRQGCGPCGRPGHPASQPASQAVTKN